MYNGDHIKLHCRGSCRVACASEAMPKHWTWQCFSGSNARLRNPSMFWRSASVVCAFVPFSSLFSFFTSIVQFMYFIELLYRFDIPSLHTSSRSHLAILQAMKRWMSFMSHSEAPAPEDVNFEQALNILNMLNVRSAIGLTRSHDCTFLHISMSGWSSLYAALWPIMRQRNSFLATCGQVWPSCNMWTCALANVVNPMETTISHCGSPVKTNRQSFVQHQGYVDVKLNELTKQQQHTVSHAGGSCGSVLWHSQLLVLSMTMFRVFRTSGWISLFFLDLFPSLHRLNLFPRRKR